MRTDEIKNYIDVRNGILSSDEVLQIVDISRNPQIDHMHYKNGVRNVWDIYGNYFTFTNRG